MNDIITKILDSLDVAYIKAESKEVLRPFEYHDAVAQKNILIRLDKGQMSANKDWQPLREGEFYFVPAGASACARFGKGEKYINATPENLDSTDAQPDYISHLNPLRDISPANNVISVFQFSTMLHKTVPFFSLLGMKPFVLPHDERLDFFLRQLCMEEGQEKIGRAMLLKNYSAEIIIMIFRFIITQRQFKDTIEKVSYLLDSRLVKIIKYIQENLSKDLSNYRLAEIALLSPDYISQFFKSLTKRNLQDYVEEQRLNKAYELVTDTSESMKEISLRVGFKDPAYFSRRFKLKFETKAMGIRKAG